jgi:hypothetical protein
MLVPERQWKQMRGQKGLAELDVSEAIGIDGRQRLFLVKVSEAAEIRLPEPPAPRYDEAEDD